MDARQRRRRLNAGGPDSAVAGAYYHDGERRRVLGNARCRIAWTLDTDAAASWRGEYQIRAADAWVTLARGGLPDSASVQVVAQLPQGVFAERDFDRQFRTTGMWQDGPLQFTYPHQVWGGAGEAQCVAGETTEQRSEVCWNYLLGDGGQWQVECRHTVWRDSPHVLERVRVTRRAAGGPVRVRCAWHVEHLPPELVSSSVKAVTHAGWRQPAGTFVVLATQLDARPWTPLSGGGGMVNLTLGDRTRDRQQYIDGKYQISPRQALLHQAPPCMDSQGWLELGPGDSYELAHYVILHPEYPFKRAFIDIPARAAAAEVPAAALPVEPLHRQVQLDPALHPGRLRGRRRLGALLEELVQPHRRPQVREVGHRESAQPRLGGLVGHLDRLLPAALRGALRRRLEPRALREAA